MNDRRTGLIKIETEEPVTHLEAWLAVRNWSRQKLADEAGISRQAVWKAATARQCGSKVALRLHKVTGVPVNDLLEMEKRECWTVELKPEPMKEQEHSAE